MAYVEFLRVRKAFYFFAGIIAAMIAFLLVSLFAAHGGSNSNFRLELGSAIILQKGTDGRIHQVPLNGIKDLNVPLAALFGIAAYCAAVFATVLSTTLNKERDGLDFTLTRPVSRERIALEYFAVDLAGVFAAFLFAFVVMCLVPLATAGLLGRITSTPQAWGILALGLGMSFMWYGIIQALTAGMRGGGGWIAGGSWAFFGVLVFLPGVTFFGPVFHYAVVALNLVNPIAYFSSLTINAHDVAARSSSLLSGLGIVTRAGITWLIGLAACAIAVASWKRIEV
jgi:hypothetical protein